MAKRGKSLTGGKNETGGITPTPRVQGYAPRTLVGIKEIRAEMARVYRFIFEGKIFPEDATKLIYMLDKMVQAIRSEAEMSAIMNQYQDAWSGVNVIAPTGEAALLAPALHVEIIGTAKQSEENENDES